MVVDASVAVKWFVDEPGRAAAMRVINSGDSLIAPDLVIWEVLNVLRRKHRQKLVSEPQIIDAGGSILACFSELMQAGVIAGQTLSLSLELNHSIYDCSYLACAMIVGAVVINGDEIFVRKIAKTRHAAYVVSLDNF